MEKFLNFTAAVEKLLGFDPQIMSKSKLIETINRLRSKNMDFEALLMVVYGLNTEPDENLLEYLTGLTGVKFDQNDLRLLKEKKHHYYQEELAFAVNNPIKTYELIIKTLSAGVDKYCVPFLLIFKCFKTPNRDLILVNKLQEFLSNLMHWPGYIQEAYLMFDNLSSSMRQKLLELIISILNELNENERIVTLYFYYEYLRDEYTITRILKYAVTNSLMNKEDSFDQYYSWSDRSLEELKSDYQEVRKSYEGPGDKLSDILRKKAYPRILMLCMYAKMQNDPEVEAAALWHAIKKQRSLSLETRMSEITGFALPTVLNTLGREQRGKWITNRLIECQNFYLHNNMKGRDSAKLVYPLQPFSLVVLYSLCKIHKKYGDKEAYKMIQASIHQMKTYFLLKSFLTFALADHCKSTVELLLKRLEELKFQYAAASSAKEVLRQLSPKDVGKIDLVGRALSFYANHATQDELKKEKYLNTVKKWTALNEESKKYR